MTVKFCHYRRKGQNNCVWFVGVLARTRRHRSSLCIRVARQFGRNLQWNFNCGFL